MKTNRRTHAVVEVYGRRYHGTVEDIGPTRATVTFRRKDGVRETRRLPYIADGRAHVVNLHYGWTFVAFEVRTDSRGPLPVAVLTDLRDRERTKVLRLDRRDGDRLAIHIEAFDRSRGDARVPGARSAARRAI